MDRSARLASVLVGVAVAALSAREGEGAKDRCTELRFKASAKAAAITVKCFTKASARSREVSEMCLSSAARGLSESLGRVRARRGCQDDQAIDETAEYVDSLNRDYARALTGVLSPEICDDGIDQNLDGYVDCEDSFCRDEPGCFEDCLNRIDDDRDGLTDCADGECSYRPTCTEFNCTNGIDDDGQGDIDCADSDCASVRSCGEDCANGVDDNGNGLVDCTDVRHCSDDPSCRETQCGDGLDDDQDGSVDCFDADCTRAAACREDCVNGVDDNHNGRVDCADGEQCAREAPCIESNCTNGIDDDADGYRDCDDPACVLDPGCVELCDNGTDDNRNGRIDCADVQFCSGARSCRDSD